MSLSYEETVEKLHSKGMFYIDLGLGRISKVLDAFDNPQDALRCIHVAGTNGKGSVCSIIDSILREAGFKTGLYTSPHIYEYTERIMVSGKEITKEDFALYFQKVYEKSNGLKIHLTEFEVLTVMMFLYFADKKVDFVILETGMGGRFDATNVIKKNLCSVITRIDLDHTDRLGNTKEEIAFEKAGIIKSGSPVITSMEFESIKCQAKELGSVIVSPQKTAEKEYIEALSLKGIHQSENLTLALTAVKYLLPNISKETVLNALPKVKNPFRFEYFKDNNLIVDASHNPDGISALRENLDYYFPNQQRRFIFGCLRTKDYKKMMEILFKEGDEVYLNGFDYPNACTYEELKPACPVKAHEYRDNLVLEKDKLNIICGSFYMIGKMKLLPCMNS